ncbi:hypothetical protein [Glycomyces tenuis]|uniref:hypothetical protein n=1 Tax=Glycomyces tenuis TaxID=58116 RepID=UPI0003F86DD7|nr:hypothetical protein [Glycomyces tenuis]
MASSFQFDERGFKRLMQSQAQEAVDDLAREQTRELDQLREEYTGRPIEEIKAALQRLFAKDGGSITDPELSQWAQLISDGRRIEIRSDTIRW